MKLDSVLNTRKQKLESENLVKDLLLIQLVSPHRREI